MLKLALASLLAAPLPQEPPRLEPPVDLVRLEAPAPFELWVEREAFDAEVAAELLADPLARLVRALARRIELDDERGPLQLVLLDAVETLPQHLATPARELVGGEWRRDLDCVLVAWHGPDAEADPEPMLAAAMRDAALALLSGDDQGAHWARRGLARLAAYEALDRLDSGLPLDSSELREVHALLADLPRRLVHWPELVDLLDKPLGAASPARRMEDLRAALLLAYLERGATDAIAARVTTALELALERPMSAVELVGRLEATTLVDLERGFDVWFNVVAVQQLRLAAVPDLEEQVAPSAEALRAALDLPPRTPFCRARLALEASDERLLALARAPLPTTAPSTELALVAARRAAEVPELSPSTRARVTTFARSALRSKAHGLEASDLLSARIHRTDDRLRLRYDFAPGVLADFEFGRPEVAHDEVAHDEVAHDEVAHDEVAHDEVAHDEVAHDDARRRRSGGGVTFEGVLEHLVDFGAPLRVEAAWRQSAGAEFRVTALARGEGEKATRTTVTSDGHFVCDLGGGRLSRRAKRGSARSDGSRSLIIEVRGSASDPEVSVTLDGQRETIPIAAAASVFETPGRVALEAEGAIHLVSLEIEGRVTSEGLERARERWVAGQLKALLARPE